MGRRKSCSDRDGSLLARTHPSQGGWLLAESSSDSENLLRRPPPPPARYGSPAPTSSSWRPPKDLRIFVGTWNVGGRAPHGGLDLADWLRIDGPASSSSPHIYVLGYEIVPLNAGNVLGAEDKGPARKWLDLIRRALNPPCPAAGPAASASCSRSRRSPSGRVSFSDLLAAAAADDDDSCRPSTASSSSEPDNDDDDLASEPSSTSTTTTPSSSSDQEELEAASGGGGGGYYHYRLAASKQMVGVLLCVWVRADAAPRVAGVAASRVGTGVLGYMGNKGAVSVSLALRGAAAPQALCFVCTHLASGDRPGDEARRNADAAEILRRTRFGGGIGRGRRPPETIMAHDKVIWLGDLNYRLVTAGNGGARELVEREDWEALLERDQLRAERSAGRVFAGAGWEEGRVRFPPTYKYVADSDAYAIDDDDDAPSPHPGPAVAAAAPGGPGRRRRRRSARRHGATAFCGAARRWSSTGTRAVSRASPTTAPSARSSPSPRASTTTAPPAATRGLGLLRDEPAARRRRPRRRSSCRGPGAGGGPAAHRHRTRGWTDGACMRPDNVVVTGTHITIHSTGTG
ncbi:hypothetical protein U9M48_041586 [Paspalum notatum var. saurae]|uniref:Inositol polyphosphate-related phosphatase domain-containing protein n=1 Tax=Paspalum notatum var. saurae TaxID=547442 RepID=A0AAQ3XEB8_PASNO